MPQAEVFRPESGQLLDRDAIPARYKWDLGAICRDWDDWTASFRELEAGIEGLKAFEGTLAEGADQLLTVFKAQDRVEALMYKVWYFTSLPYDQDQRDNTANARRQQVQILFAKHQQATSWFNPELLAIPLETVRGWMKGNADLAVYRFAIESLYHEQDHVLDADGERLLSFAGRFAGTPYDAYAALT